MPITVVFDPPLPSDSPSTFNTKAFTLLGDLNDWSTQANALPGEVATNLTTLLAAPPAIGSTTPAAGSFTTIGANDTITAYKGIVISSAGTTYAAGAMGYNDANIGMLFRPPRAGALLAYDLRDFAGTSSVLKITDAGAATIPGSLSLTGGTFGYGTGAGGTVTQATSKSTAVTLNKPSGQITMDGAALGAGASVTFSVTNSFLTSNTDGILCSVAGGVSNLFNYTVLSASAGGGLFYINVKNETVGSLSEAVVIQFEIIRGATT